MQTLCANESALRSYLRTVDQEERRLDAIEIRVEKLLAGELSDSRADMVLEAMQETNEATADLVAILIGHVASAQFAIDKKNHYEGIGRLVAEMIAGYCERLARQIAEREINGASCNTCFDEGCRRCGQ